MNVIPTAGEQVGSARTNLFPFDAPICGVRRLLGYALGVNINSANTDFALVLQALLPACNYIIRDISINNAQINNGGTITNSATTATLGVFTAAAGGGTAIVANAAISGLSALTGAGGNLQLTIATTGFMATQAANNTIYVRTGTAQGASTSATVDIYIFGEVLV